MEDFSFKFKASYLQLYLYYKCYLYRTTTGGSASPRLVPQLAPSVPEAPCTDRLCNWRLVLLRLHQLEPWVLGKYDFMYAKT
jgi:hypothetical protein